MYCSDHMELESNSRLESNGNSVNEHCQADCDGSQRPLCGNMMDNHL